MLPAVGVRGPERTASQNAGFVWESAFCLSDHRPSAGNQRKGGKTFSSRKYNSKSKIGCCFEDAAMGQQLPPSSNFFYPLFWKIREERKGIKRGQEKGKRRILHHGVGTHSLRNQETHPMGSLVPWWCPAPNIRIGSSLCSRLFHLGRFYSPVSYLSDGKCVICHMACSRNSLECVGLLVWVPGAIGSPPAQVTFFSWESAVFLVFDTLELGDWRVIMLYGCPSF